jgi:serine/threonine-protein kinase SRK2
MEFAAGGDLFDLVKSAAGSRLSEDRARSLFQQLIIGLDYTHSKGVANRDIKLENVLISAPGRHGEVKIADFGYSKHEHNSSARTTVGTTMYISPEIIIGRGSYNAKKADIWSLGVVLYCMLCGRFPFDPTSRNGEYGIALQ